MSDLLNMYNKRLYVAIIAFLFLQVFVDAKKSRRLKRPKDEEDATLQPSVVSYSTFGFNDVGSYDGFIPTSPDYASYLTNNQESATRLYAPAFPTALDTMGFENNYGSQSDGHSLSSMDDSGQQNTAQYSQNMNFFNSPNFDNSDNQNTRLLSVDTQGRNTGDGNSPVYGTKLGSKSKKPANNTDYNLFHNSNLGNPSDVSLHYNIQHDERPPSSENKPVYGESVNNYPNVPNPAPTFPPVEVEDFVNPGQSNGHGLLKFPKVIDFTKVSYPNNIENKYNPISYDSFKHAQDENFKSNYEDNNSKFNHNPSIFKDSSPFHTKTMDENKDKLPPKQSSYVNSDYNFNYINTPPPKNDFKSAGLKYNDNDDFKTKFQSANNGNYSSEFKRWKRPAKGYEYSTNYSSTSFTYDFDESKKPLNNNFDEIIPASSNTVDLTNYQVPDNEYPSSFKKIPDFKQVFDFEYSNSKPQEKYKPEEYLNQFKNLYSNDPSPTSQWGNVYKSSDFFSHKYHPKKPVYSDEINSDIVHIPKRPHATKYGYGKHFENSPASSTDWLSAKTRPKSFKYKPLKDWSNDHYNNNNFKTEEDLLDLRNHDTSNPSYLPTYRPNDNDLLEDSDYKKLIEKWRQSYWKAKFKDSYRDFEGYSSETKPLHVPVPKPYPIEVPHPVIVPVPQPYPVRVPVPKPVAVPVIRELTIPIEKPMPYPVIKKVPYPVEKPVPVPVEKEVAVPVVKPYPVHIPHVRPVFHHSRPPRDEYESDNGTDDDDDYFPRPEGGKKIVSYKKRPVSTRNRQRRPTRTTYQDRNSRRRAPRRPTDSYSRRPYSTHIDFHYSPPYRFKDSDSDYESESTDFISYCKRTRNC